MPVNGAWPAEGPWEPWMADVAAGNRWNLAFILLLLGRPTEAEEAVRGFLRRCIRDLQGSPSR